MHSFATKQPRVVFLFWYKCALSPNRNRFNSEQVLRRNRPKFDEAFTLHHRTVLPRRAPSCATRSRRGVTQEVFLALSTLDSAPDPELLPLVMRVTLNEARNTIRGQSRAMARDTSYQKSTDETVTPSFEYENRQQMDLVRQALDKIKEPMRSCLLLRHQGSSYREIAQTLSLKENYVGSLVARARKEFARTYGKLGVSQ